MKETVWTPGWGVAILLGADIWGAGALAKGAEASACFLVVGAGIEGTGIGEAVGACPAAFCAAGTRRRNDEVPDCSCFGAA